MKIVKNIALILLLIFGLIIVGGASIEFEKEGFTKSELVVFVLFGILPVAVSIFFFIKMRNETNEKTENMIISKIIAIAQQQEGKITTLDVMRGLSMSVDEAKETLDELYSDGVLMMDISDKGGIQYELNRNL